jgi:hypothetical protein
VCAAPRMWSVAFTGTVNSNRSGGFMLTPVCDFVVGFVAGKRIALGAKTHAPAARC